MVLVRSIQLAGTLVSAGLNGFLLAHITINRLGPSQTLVSLEWMICLLLCYTALNLLILHTRGRSKKTPWLVFFVVMDILCCGAILAIITLLARAGVPSNCAGMTIDPTADKLKNTVFHDDDNGFSTPRFSDEIPGSRGQLDKLCAYERAYYFISVGLIFTFMAMIVLTILRICQGKYTKNNRVYQTMDALHGQDSYELALKLENSRCASHMSSPRVPPPAPQSEGYMSRRTSMRPPSRQPQSHHNIVTQSIPEQPPSHGFGSPPPHPASPISPLSPIRPEAPSSPPPPLGLGIASDNSAESLAAAAMITDGARFGGGYQPGMSTLPPYSPSSPVHLTPPHNGSADNLGYSTKGSMT